MVIVRANDTTGNKWGANQMTGNKWGRPGGQWNDRKQVRTNEMTGSKWRGNRTTGCTGTLKICNGWNEVEIETAHEK